MMRRPVLERSIAEQVCRVERVDLGPQIIGDRLCERAWVLVPLEEAESALPDGLLEGFELRDFLRRRGLEVWPPSNCICSITEIEIRVVLRDRCLERPVPDLQFRQAGSADVLPEPRHALHQFAGEFLRWWHPSVPLAQEAHKERATVLHLLEAQRQRHSFARLLVRDAPAQVDDRRPHHAVLGELVDLGFYFLL